MHFLRRPFEFPEPLDRALRDALWGSHPPDASARRPFERGLRELWPALAQQRGQTGGSKHYSLRREQAEAYAAYYLPANAMKIPLILEEARAFGLKMNDASGQPWRWLDVGSGPGTAYWGLAWWAQRFGVACDFVGLEQSPEFVKLAATLSRSLSSELGLSPSASRWELFRHGAAGRSLADWTASQRPHVLSMMNSVGELSVDLDKRAELVGEALDALSAVAKSDPDGGSRWLVIVEPGSKHSSRELLALREKLLERNDVRVWFPCLSARACGALAGKDDWCHEESEVRFPRWMEALGAAAGLRKEAVLFSYLVASVGKHAPEPKSWPGAGSRVVSQIMKEKGLTQCFLCSPSGKRKARVLDSRATPETEPFTQSVRGQIYPHVHQTEKGDVTGFTVAEAEVEADATVFPPLRSDRRS